MYREGMTLLALRRGTKAGKVRRLDSLGDYPFPVEDTLGILQQRWRNFTTQLRV